MRKVNQNVINERSIPIPINKKTSTTMKTNLTKREYSLKQNSFDPTKSSPPNDFMIKLHMRIHKYYVDNNDVSFDIK